MRNSFLFASLLAWTCTGQAWPGPYGAESHPEQQPAGPASPQGKWLLGQLADAQKRAGFRFSVVYMHRPPYSSGEHGSDIGLRTKLAPVLEKHHVQLVLAGHDHDYERMVPQGGTEFLVTGGGGIYHRTVEYTQPVVQSVWNNLPLEKGEELAARAPLNLNDLLPAERSYFTYMGSLTTPPCSEGVLWMVMKAPVQISADQIGIFARLYPMNARPIQSAAGRLIKESN